MRQYFDLGERPLEVLRLDKPNAYVSYSMGETLKSLTPDTLIMMFKSASTGCE